MATATLGRVAVTAEIENVVDSFQHMQGTLPADQVRRVAVTDALVDTGATTLMLPRRMARQLGLKPLRTRTARGIGGLVAVPVYGAVRLTIQGRDCTIDVGEIDDSLPVLIGQVPLELLDFVADMGSHTLVGNPAHGGEHMMEY